MQAWIFRFGNVVGSPMAHGILHDFITKLRQNPREMEILGDGDQEKNYLLVEECIDAMLFAIRNARERSCDVFNLGCESTVKASDIARIIAEEMEADGVSFRYSGGRQGWPGDVTLVVYDVTKMKRLGWQAKYTSAEAIRIAVRRLLGKEQPVSPAGQAAGRKPR
jgi:UDP-glucose 4-epimerase